MRKYSKLFFGFIIIFSFQACQEADETIVSYEEYKTSEIAKKAEEEPTNETTEAETNDQTQENNQTVPAKFPSDVPFPVEARIELVSEAINDDVESYWIELSTKTTPDEIQRIYVEMFKKENWEVDATRGVLAGVNTIAAVKENKKANMIITQNEETKKTQITLTLEIT